MSQPPPYPRAGHEGVPEPTGWRRWAPSTGIAVAIIAAVALVVGLGLWFLIALGSSL